MRKVNYSMRKLHLLLLELKLQRALPGVTVEWTINEVQITLSKDSIFVEITGLHEGWKAVDFDEFEAKTIRTLKEYL